ncbi:MAG: SRPBCC domain-containing protein [Flavobacteriales bacterium]
MKSLTQFMQAVSYMRFKSPKNSRARASFERASVVIPTVSTRNEQVRELTGILDRNRKGLYQLGFITTLIIMTTTATTIMAQNGKANTVRTTFSRETSVSIDIQAEVAEIWSLLTNAANYPSWNSTVTSITGSIALGETIRLKSTLDAKREFKLKVKEFEVNKRLVWGDGKGERVYTLTDQGNGTVTFTMVEKIGGLMFPMYAKYIPPFDASFEQFAMDLKKASEKNK